MRNWTIKEAVEVIKAGTDAEAVKEIARINPLFVVAVAKDDVVTLANMMGEKFTVRRLEVNGAVTDADEEDGAMNPPATETEDGTEDLEAMSTKQLMALCDKRGIKVPKYGKNKQFYLDALQNAGNATEAETEDTDAEDTEETTEDAYEGKSAMELFKECKKRGIKAEQKKPAKYYIGLLKKADEAEAEEEEAEDEGWEDDEEAEEAPKAKPAKGGKGKATAKAEKAAPAKSTSKSKAKAEAEDDDDEEWDI